MGWFLGKMETYTSLGRGGLGGLGRAGPDYQLHNNILNQLDHRIGGGYLVAGQEDAQAHFNLDLNEGAYFVPELIDQLADLAYLNADGALELYQEIQQHLNDLNQAVRQEHGNHLINGLHDFDESDWLRVTINDFLAANLPENALRYGYIGGVTGMVASGIAAINNARQENIIMVYTVNRMT